MKATVNISDKSYRIDLSRGDDISIPLIFNGEQPNVYNTSPAEAWPYKDDNFIGDTRKGGSSNFEEINCIPHCNGTHTECVGHISHERLSIHAILKNTFIPATLVTIKPTAASETRDTYNPAKEKTDQLITRNSLEHGLASHAKDFLQGLIIRTLPNSKNKKSRNYMSDPPPYLSIEAMQFILELGTEHLLVDTPSIDRTFDEGRLTAHHLFWEIEQGSHEVHPTHHSRKTITEMIYVDDRISEGPYFLNLQIPSFVADAAPSRIIMYKAIEK